MPNRLHVAAAAVHGYWLSKTCRGTPILAESGVVQPLLPRLRSELVPLLLDGLPAATAAATDLPFIGRDKSRPGQPLLGATETFANLRAQRDDIEVMRILIDQVTERMLPPHHHTHTPFPYCQVGLLCISEHVCCNPNYIPPLVFPRDLRLLLSPRGGCFFVLEARGLGISLPKLNTFSKWYCGLVQQLAPPPLVLSSVSISLYLKSLPPSIPSCSSSLFPAF